MFWCSDWHAHARCAEPVAVQFYLFRPRQADGLTHFETYDRGAIPFPTLLGRLKHAAGTVNMPHAVQGSVGSLCTGPWMQWPLTEPQVSVVHATMQAVRSKTCVKWLTWPAVILEIAEHLQELDISVEAIHCEGGPGQFEVSPGSRLCIGLVSKACSFSTCHGSQIVLQHAEALEVRG